MVERLETSKILEKAAGVLGSPDEAQQWMQRPAIDLNGKRPIDVIATAGGAERVDVYLERMRYCIYT